MSDEGRSSMKMLDRLKPLFAESPLFHEPGASRAEERKRLGKRKGGLKIGQGGASTQASSREPSNA